MDRKYIHPCVSSDVPRFQNLSTCSSSTCWPAPGSGWFELPDDGWIISLTVFVFAVCLSVCLSVPIRLSDLLQTTDSGGMDALTTYLGTNIRCRGCFRRATLAYISTDHSLI